MLFFGPCAKALATTPAAGKFYRSAGEPARVDQHFRVGAGASLEWLPQETIVYDGAVAALATRVELTPGACFFGWEIICLGLAASNKPFVHGEFRQRLEIWQDARPLLIENLRCRAGDRSLIAPWGLSGHTVAATFVCTLGAPGGPEPFRQAALAAAREAVSPFTRDNLVAACLCDGLLVCRLHGRDSAAAKKAFIAAWRALRPLTLGRLAHPPRIWAT
ncbi:MAG: urease accessory protein UreD [Desulfovibrionaceae bacterium]|nr:urease accessory protein UreD [Desulfovibrionaceae bacterium]